jgi:hypothetical protein
MLAFPARSMFSHGASRVCAGVVRLTTGLPVVGAELAPSKEGGAGRFGTLLDEVARIPNGRQPMLNLLLDSLLPIPTQIDPDLRPIWANEAMQRAYDIVQLFSSLERARPYRGACTRCLRSEQAYANDLAEVYTEIKKLGNQAVQPCAGVLKMALLSIDGLFSAVSGVNRISCTVEVVGLKAVKRRALVLVACRLVTSILNEQTASGQDINVKLIGAGPGVACLSVFASSEALNRYDDIVDDLADLLQAAVCRTCQDSGPTRVDLLFPTGKVQLDRSFGLSDLMALRERS